MTKTTASDNGKLWLKKEMRPYRVFIFLLTVLTVLSTVLSLAFAYLVGNLVNSATARDTRLLWIFSAVLLGVLLLRIGLQALNNYASEKLRARMVSELRVRCFEKILRSDYARLNGYHSGDLLNRLTTDVQEVVVDSVGLMPAVVGMIVQCVGAVVALLTIDPLFTAIYVVSGSVFGLLTALYRKKIKKTQKEVLQADGEVRSFMQEGLSSVMTLKAYGAEAKSTGKAKTLAGEYYDKRMKRNTLRSSMNALFSLLSNFGLIFAVIWCSIGVLLDDMAYGSILSVILLLMQLQHPFAAFSSVVPTYYARLTSGERLSELDELPREAVAQDSGDCKRIYRELQEIAFENVAFDYGREGVLTNANAVLKKGEIVCLTGASGTGKSTLFKLLLSVYTPSRGRILLKGKETVELTARDRGLFAYVPQGRFLFSGTIYENLTFFADESDEVSLRQRVETALSAACADFVRELPQGLDTPLGEGGAGLSEGQTQRLAVARALVSDRPILLLDEATSALDGETERRLLENVRSLKDKTCLIVTHRPAALTIADRVLKVENGDLTELKV